MSGAPLWQRITADEFATLERGLGQPIVTIGRRHWRRVRPFFYRPLLPYQTAADAQVPVPLAARWGAAQYAVAPDQPANSFLNVLMFPRAPDYSLAQLNAKRRWEVNAAAKSFEVRAVTDREDFRRQGFAVYHAFYRRTGYAHLSERRHREGFDQWADRVFAISGTTVLAAFRDGTMHAASLSQWVEDTLVYSTFFASDECLRLHVPGLVLHRLREHAAGCAGLEQVFVGLVKPGPHRSIDDFYLLRGCQVRKLPARLRGNPATLAFLRRFQPHLYGAIVDSTSAPRS